MTEPGSPRPGISGPGGNSDEKVGPRLIIFTRYPEQGNTKTRLIPALGPTGAAELQRRMTEHTLNRARRFQGEHSATIEVRYQGGTGQLMEEWLGPDLCFCPQGKGDLGERMKQAFEASFNRGSGHVVLIGTDCPGLTPGHLHQAFRFLEEHDLVLGPANDGGYYLIGLGREVASLFHDIPWGRGDVLEKTLKIAKAQTLDTAILELLDDVDRPEDLLCWEQETGRAVAPGQTPGISIIIPALDEAESIEPALASTRGSSRVVERIVVDGGSRDETMSLAHSLGARVLSSPPGKARQMNAGARAAKGDILLFLHADTSLPPGFDHHVQEVLGRPGTVAGAFRFQVKGQHGGLRLVEQLANFRSLRMSMPYGDQGIFLRAQRFWEVGGFPEMPLMEDFELMRRLRKQGLIGIASAAAVTSARRYRDHGVLWPTILNQIIILSYLIGVSPDRLARWYRLRAGKRQSSLEP